MYPGVPIMTCGPAIAGRDRDAEVGDPGSPVLIDQDVGGLQVAVKNALRMSRRETRTQLAGDLEHPFGGQTSRALEQGREVLPAHELHREEDRLAGFTDVEDADTPPGV